MENPPSSSPPGSSAPANPTSTETAAAIGLVNAAAIGEQPAVLANLALANQIFAANLQQQNALAQQQALNQLTLAIVAKCANLILTVDPASSAEVKPILDGLLQLLERIQQITPVLPAPVSPKP